jgi:hypothetical protein
MNLKSSHLELTSDLSNEIAKYMVKKYDSECCICLEIGTCVKLENCEHYLCPICYYKLRYGFIRDKFYINNPYPVCPKEPNYPYINMNENIKIYKSLTSDDTYLDWFVNENQDLYNCIKTNEDFVCNVDKEIIKWFEDNETIKNYEYDITQYDLSYKKYTNDIDIYYSLLEEEKENNIIGTCPLCRSIIN